MSSSNSKLNGSAVAGSNALDSVQNAESMKNGLWGNPKIPEAWATPAAASTDPAASSSSTDKETTSIFATVNKAQADTSKKDEKAVKVENSPFVALYQPGGLLAWPGAGTSAVNGLGNLPSAIPTLPLPQFPALSQTNGANNIAQAMRMLNSYQTGAAAMMRFNNGTGLFGGPMKRFNRTPVACVVCHKAKSTCDSNRPCARCTRLGKAHLCKDRPHKKKGRPPKKRTSSEAVNSETSKSKRKATVKQEKFSLPIPTPSTGSSLLKSVFSQNLTSSTLPGASVDSKAKSAEAAAIESFNPILDSPFKSPMTGDSKSPSNLVLDTPEPSSTQANTAGKETKKGDASASPESKDEFSKIAESVDKYLWEEVIDDMSSFFIKHPEVLSNELAALYAGSNSRGTGTPFQTSVMDLPPGTQVLSPLFCMYLTYMSYYLHADQFTMLQRRMAKLGVIIPNLSNCPIRKFDTSIAKSVGNIKAIAPVFRFRWCRKKPSVGIPRDLNFPMATLKVSFYRSSNPRTFLLFIRVNEEFENVFGYKQAEVVKMSTKPFYYQLIHPKDWKKQLSLEMSMLLNKRRRFNTFIQCLCKWKEEICCLETFQFHFNNQDLMTHFTITFSPLPKYLFEKDSTPTAEPPSKRSKTAGSSAVPPAAPLFNGVLETTTTVKKEPAVMPTVPDVPAVNGGKDGIGNLNELIGDKKLDHPFL
ncbi:hypothetical protein AAMO2058_000238800 [Amorphochlora amoebiformis]